MDRNGQNSPNDEKIQQGRITNVAGKVSARPDGAPDQGGVEMRARVRTAEAVDCGAGAYAGDVAERPV